MARINLRVIPALVFAASLTQLAIAQNPASQSQPQSAQSQTHPESNQASQIQPTKLSFTLRTTTRMVNLELVVEDAKHRHIDGLKASDFNIFEQTPSRSGEKREQKIVEFREVHVADLKPAPASHAAPGIYSNAVTVQKDPVPPTILLVDGLNTPIQHQAQVHVQMLKMLRQLPANVPVAVFLLGDRLTMLQSFTSDPKLLQAALTNLTTPSGVGVASVQPQDDPDAAGNSMGGMGVNDPTLGDLAAAASNFDKAIYSEQMDERVLRTTNALVSIASNAAGYPGRKNLLWLSTAFPITVDPVPAALGVDDQRLYISQLQRVNKALNEAKVSVYPINVAGVTTSPVYQASTRPASGLGAMVQAMGQDQDSLEQDEHDTMQVIADGTGGKVCTGDNDLGDCVRKAMDDSSDFYEISYYPDSPYWSGEFRNISVKTEVRGARLAYRQGYFANPQGSSDVKVQEAQLRSDCNNYLDATEIPFLARSLPADAQGTLRFSLMIDPAPVTFAPMPDGGHAMRLAVAVCTYNEKQWPLNLMNFPLNLELDTKQFEMLTNAGRLSDSISVPGPRPAAVRLLVEDVASGKLGSIYIKTSDAVAAAGAGVAADRQQAGH